ncbi:TetR/AcrR family transcriptional regulator [Cellulomonas fengjieae]|uniref:TetR/AcrR family transcriptional regulator n=1 Tax=Cellulomonas fengjieae TaxID=2819978 RepID=A0ABS3SC75_9CELL|nr:TetR/AcrR family transcriptional regulator [Cellulomonas fengjieae]MBO3083343.1 TetR/AcrR family transcriptional regulator [Cellulomonas fengjieae]QVI65313.1 TetR/AcrR family transcriptional regulator [Cellulomonas fengjieae]
MNARAGLTVPVLTTAAAELADEVGFDQVTVSALARRVGVQPASLYAHLRGSDDLRTRISVLALGELGDRLAVALAGRAGREALQALIDVMREYAHAHPGRWAATQVRVDITQAAAVGARVSALMTGALHGYGLAPTELPHAVRFVGSTVNGFLHLRAIGGFDNSVPDPEHSWARMADALDGALRAWPGAHPTTGARP